ncbi:YhcN/YlaJ family sporulation lipoprotein [Paenibacillus sp. SYP-B4298]|uniref:YhcN/YlaJ family sporulation lipoprotein n=1 Tax=Paenibacillus sp. SYP-B4298 TaxID=2996034 RepID=UPI0022DD98AF|nr:YhcN/YlaJ family sporulation lipoprotein [Paenibacillus sp. SYP-B4298]
MKKGAVILAAGLALTAMLAGCASNQGDVGNKSFQQNGVRQDANGNRIMNKRFANDTRNEMNRVGERRLNSNNIVGAHQNYKIDMSETAAQRVAALKEVQSAYVMLGDKNAYVAVNLHDQVNRGTTPGQVGTYATTDSIEVPSEIKRKIAAEVKQVKGNVQHVYVSANPDFVGRMTGYMNDVRAGHPIQGLIAEFNAMVERVFPQQAEPVR